MGADEAGDDAAAVDIADEHDRHVGRLGEAHVGDVAGAEIDLGRAAGALDQHDVHAFADDGEAFQHSGQQFTLPPTILGGAHRPCPLALHDDLRAGVGLRFEQDRVHVDRWRQPRGTCLQGLGATDLATALGDRGVVRHVLRLERRHLQPAPHERPAEPRHQHRLADVAAGALDHQRGRMARHRSRPRKVGRSQNSSMARKEKVTDQPMSRSPFRASAPAIMRMWPTGTMSPKPSEV